MLAQAVVKANGEITFFEEPISTMPPVYPTRHTIIGSALITDAVVSSQITYNYSLKSDGLTGGYTTGLTGSSHIEPLYIENTSAGSDPIPIVFIFNLWRPTLIEVGWITVNPGGATIKMAIASAPIGSDYNGWTFVDAKNTSGVTSRDTSGPGATDKVFSSPGTFIATVQPDPNALPNGKGTAMADATGSLQHQYPVFTGAAKGLHALKIYRSGSGTVKLYTVSFENGPVQ